MGQRVQLAALLLVGACTSTPPFIVDAPDGLGDRMDEATLADASALDAALAPADLDEPLDFATVDETALDAAHAPIIATQLRWKVSPANGPSGALGALVVIATDDLGQPATDFTSNITVSVVVGPPGGVLAGTTTQAATSGAALFSDLGISRKGTYQLLAKTSGLSDGLSQPFDLWGSRLVFTQQPAKVHSNQAFAKDIAVTVEDGDGTIDAGFEGTVLLTLVGNPTATLAGITTRPLQNGVAIFPGLSVDVWGTRSLRASVADLPSADSIPFRTACSRLQIDPPLTVVAGTPVAPAPQVRCVDETGAVDLDASDSLTVSAWGGFSCPWQDAVGSWSLLSGTADLPGVTWFKAATQCGLYATGSDYVSGLSGAFDIVAGPPSSLHIAGPDVARPAGAGIPFSLDAQIVDAFGNVANISGVPLTLSSGDPLTGLGTLPSNAGHATFSNVFSPSVGPATIQLSASGYTDVQQPIKIGAWGFLSATAGFGYCSFDISSGDAADIVVYTNSGTQRSHDGGTSFTSVAVPNRFVFAPSNASIIYRFGSGGILGSAISRSSDGGASWTDLAYSPTNFLITVAPTDPDVLLLGGQLMRSIDGGATLKPVLGSSYWWVVWSRDGSLVYAQNGTTLLRSGDLGQTWTPLPAAPAQMQVAIDAFLPNRILNSSWAGEWLSTDGGSSWLDSSPRMPVGSDYVTPHPGVAGGLLTRVTDPSSHFLQSTDDGLSWSPFGDETAPQIFRMSATDPLVGYGEGIQGGVLKTLTGGNQ